MVVTEGGGRGTTVRLSVDPEIFGDARPSFDAIARHLKEVAALQPGLKVSLNNLAWCYEDGLAGWLREQGATDARRIEGEESGVRVQIAVAAVGPNVEASWVNGTRTERGGSHMDAVRTFFAFETMKALAVSVVTPSPRFAGRTKSELDSPEVGAVVARVLAAGWPGPRIRGGRQSH